MILSGGNYGGYQLIDNRIIFDGISIDVNFNNDLTEFFILDESGEKWFYRIDSIVIFIGMNLY